MKRRAGRSSATRVELSDLAAARATLKNGLVAIATPLPATHRVAIVVELRVGSRYETRKSNGVSHLLEHMLYRGIPGHPTAHAQALAFEALGSALAAATGADSGTLSLACPPDRFDAALDLLGLVFQRPLLGDLAVEKRIIREEILEHLDDRGRLVDDYDLLRRTVFGEHPLGFPITGSVEQVESFGRAALLRHHEKHYVGAATVVSVAGPIDPDRVLRSVERVFGAVKKGVSPVAKPPPEHAVQRFSYVKGNSSQTAVRVGFRGPSIQDRDEPAIELLLRVLDDGNSTRLYHRLCDEKGLVYDVRAQYEAANDSGLLDIGADTAHATANVILREILDVVRELRESGPTDAELTKAKTRHLWSLEEMLDDPGEIAEFFADATLRSYAEALRDRSERVDAVTKDDVMRAAQRLFRPEQLAAVVVGLQPKKAVTALEKQLDAFR